MILIPVLVLALGAGGWVAYSQYGQVDQAAKQVTGLFASSDTAASPTEFGSFHEIKGMIVNPTGTDGNRVLMVNVGLESQAAPVITELQDKEVVVRDLILNRMGQKTVDQLASISQRDSIKQDLRTSINKILEKGTVNRLYFTQYVLQ